MEKVLDIETHGKPWNGVLLALGWEGEVWRGDEVPDWVLAEIADPDIDIVEHSKYDAWWLRLHGTQVGGRILDTMVMAWLLKEDQLLKLDDVVKKYLRVDPDKRIKQVANVPYFYTDDGRPIALEAFALQKQDVFPTPENDLHEEWAQLIDYCGRDIKYTRQLFDYLKELLEATAWDDYWMDKAVPFTKTLVNMECNGLPIDLKAAAELRVRLDVRRVAAEKLVLEGLGYEVNLDSGDQLAEVLFKKLWYQKDSLPVPADLDLSAAAFKANLEDVLTHKEWKVETVQKLMPAGFEVGTVGRSYVHGFWLRKGFGLKKTNQPKDKKRPTVATPDLMVAHGAHPWVKDLIKWRKLNKVITTYLDAYPKHAHNGRLYGRFNQTGTVTGRLSASGPNLQNQPSRGELGHEIRGLFRGELIVGDYSQLEPRLMAHFSQDPVLLDVYNNGKDIYLMIAETIFGEVIEKDDERRGVAKTYVLGMGYGAEHKTLHRTLALNGYHYPLDQVADQLATLKAKLCVLWDWKQDHIAFAKRKGYVKTLGGRVRRLKSAFGKGATFKSIGTGERQAVNSTIQGSAGDVVIEAMLLIDQEMEMLRQLAQVHDELVMDHPGLSQAEVLPYLPQLTKLAEEGHGFDLTVPLVFEPNIGNSWAAAKDGELDLSTLFEDVS